MLRFSWFVAHFPRNNSMLRDMLSPRLMVSMVLLLVLDTLRFHSNLATSQSQF